MKIIVQKAKGAIIRLIIETYSYTGDAWTVVDNQKLKQVHCSLCKKQKTQHSGDGVLYNFDTQRLTLVIIKNNI